MKTFADYPLKEMKLLYTVLHKSVPQHPALMDVKWLFDLQHYLMLQASNEGIDVTLHTEWAAWLAKP